MIDLSPLERHEKIALGFSGGKDSLAVVYLLQPYLDRLAIYHLDTGDLLPEVMDVVDHVRGFAPNFITVRSDVMAWQAANGLPTDLLPFGSHPVGRAIGHEAARLVGRYDCCYSNLMLPLYQRVVSDGNTLLIRGTKHADPLRLPMADGEKNDAIELWLPIKDWSNAEVFDYLRSVDAPISRIYDHVTNSPECARCSAWWGEKRAAYLREYHPALFADYAARLRIVADALTAPLTMLAHEMEGI
jgi:3'-phosphoadenosine 5'-phosphosulfate sulfotransferase (PAPS reductase)/FAD synthetase